jgi:hypothetical protein
LQNTIGARSTARVDTSHNEMASEVIGQHSGNWVTVAKLIGNFQMMDADGTMKPITVDDLAEGVYVELNGIWFTLFLFDRKRDRFFVEVIS